MKYKLIYADCPWRFKVWDRATGLDRSPDAHYQTMDLEELMAMPVDEWAARDSLLAMWTYDPMFPEALKLGQYWGFDFVTVLFRWIKTTDGQFRMFDQGERLGFGMGYHTRAGGCEECWLFRRGRGLPVLRHDIRREFFSPVREHSRKPNIVADWLVDLYGDVPRLEMFARTKRAGWISHGFETGKFKEIA